MANGELKKFVVENGLYARYASARKRTYLKEIGESVEGETKNDFECFLAREYGEKWFEIVGECERIGNTSRQRVRRLKSRVADILSKGECLFLTLTFNDNTLLKTDKHQRSRMVNKYLKSQSCDFIANIDFGKVNNREHYHALICASVVDYTKWHENGAVRGEKVHLKGGKGDNIARYIDKLSLHALKDTTYRNRMLYSTSGLMI